MNARRDQSSRLVRVLMWLFLAIWMLSNVLWLQYAATRPKTPVPETGNIYALSTHGSRAYLTSQDCLCLYGTMGVGFGGLLALYAVRLWRRGWVAP